jgi:hypothetical protein
MPNEPDKKRSDVQAEIEAARARAKAYMQGTQAESPATAQPAAPKKTRSESEWTDAVSQAIEEAMRKGDFDNLRGRGKPLPRRDNAFTPEGSELAYEILKNNDLTPGWIGDRKAMQQEVAQWRAQLRADAARMAADWAAASTPEAQQVVRSRWESRRPSLREGMDALNRRMRDLNLQQPVSDLHLFMLRLAEEERRAGIPEALLS